MRFLPPNLYIYISFYQTFSSEPAPKQPHTILRSTPPHPPTHSHTCHPESSPRRIADAASRRYHIDLDSRRLFALNTALSLSLSSQRAQTSKSKPARSQLVQLQQASRRDIELARVLSTRSGGGLSLSTTMTIPSSRKLEG